MRQGLDLQELHEAWSTVPPELVDPVTDIGEISWLTRYIYPKSGSTACSPCAVSQ